MTQTIQIKDPAAPASPAQTNYLDVLVTQRELPAVCERYALLKGLGAVTKGQASAWIGELLAAPKKTTATPAQAFTAAAQKIAATYAAPAPVDTPKLETCPSFGYYVQTDGTLLYWDVTGKDAYPTLRRLTIVTNYDGSKKGKWSKVYPSYAKKTSVQATWLPYAGKGYVKAAEKTGWINVPYQLVDLVTDGIAPLSQEAAGKLGKQFGFCVRCGATLTDPVSVANGLGPVCAKYWM